MIHTEIAKIAKERTTTDRRVTQSRSVFATFLISVCKIPITKDDAHGDRKDREGTDELRIKGYPIPNRS
jgi:hypothetical protein